jgi:hypothetical protein
MRRPTAGKVREVSDTINGSEILRTKLYAKELLKKLVAEKDLEILEAVWDDELGVDQKIERLLGGK